jgi:uncharacterized protein YjbJ (UPF0337 family)
MNSGQFVGVIKELVGKAQTCLGKLVDSPFQQDSGMRLQNAGRLQVFLGDLKELEELEIRDQELDKRWDSLFNFRG